MDEEMELPPLSYRSSSPSGLLPKRRHRARRRGEGDFVSFFFFKQNKKYEVLEEDKDDKEA